MVLNHDSQVHFRYLVTVRRFDSLNFLDFTKTRFSVNCSSNPRSDRHLAAKGLLC